MRSRGLGSSKGLGCSSNRSPSRVAPSRFQYIDQAGDDFKVVFGQKINRVPDGGRMPRDRPGGLVRRGFVVEEILHAGIQMPGKLLQCVQAGQDLAALEIRNGFHRFAQDSGKLHLRKAARLAQLLNSTPNFLADPHRHDPAFCLCTPGSAIDVVLRSGHSALFSYSARCGNHEAWSLFRPQLAKNVLATISYWSPVLCDIAANKLRAPFPIIAAVANLKSAFRCWDRRELLRYGGRLRCGQLNRRKQHFLSPPPNGGGGYEEVGLKEKDNMWGL